MDTSVRFTADTSPPGRRGITASAPFSAKTTARIAEASSTNLVTFFALGVLPAIKKKFIHRAFARNLVGCERRLDFLDDLSIWNDAQAILVQFERHRIPEMKADLVAEFGGNDDSSAFAKFGLIDMIRENAILP